MILISDGEDSTSEYSYTETLEFAKRVGVSIYAIGLNLSHRAAEGRNQLTRLANETGGSSYFVNRASVLERTYAAIEEELRSQLLIGAPGTGITPQTPGRVQLLAEERP